LKFLTIQPTDESVGYSRSPFRGSQLASIREIRVIVLHAGSGGAGHLPQPGFILRQGWTGLDFSDEVELAELRRLHETLQLEIIAVIEALGRLQASDEFELCGIVEQKPGVLDELAAERIRRLETESAELQRQAAALAKEIEELNGEAAGRIG
jgi:hypothetical protein